MKTGLQKVLVLCLLITSANVHAQVDEWTWVKGDNGINVQPVYGTMGAEAAANTPGGRMSSLSWADSANNFWVFGGVSWPPFPPYNFEYYSDLWRYNAATNNWTWMKGDNVTNVKGVYGVKGIASTANKPGGRESGMSWTDALGNLWLFGGFGYGIDQSTLGFLNDVWKYNVATNEWTWLSGDSSIDNAGIYGIQGVASAANKPGSRATRAVWADNTGIVWMFGGSGIAASGSQTSLNDLWKYNMTTNEWTWVKGDSTGAVNGQYGTMGVSSAQNKPGSRGGSNTWTDAQGNLWLFGGSGLDATGSTFPSGLLNDLWKYNPVINEWVWVNGSNLNSQKGKYLGAGSYPGARTSEMSAKDANGNFWMFGGFGYAKSDTSGGLNDIWKYTVSTNEWTWVKGDTVHDQPGVYGTQGIASPYNKPGGRNGCNLQRDGSGHFWLFGGRGFAGSIYDVGLLNDVWYYTPNSTLPLHLLNFTAHLSEQRTANSEQKAIVNLRWTAENEINFDRYEVERSVDGREFSKIGAVSSRQYAAGSRQYAYDDRSLPTANCQLYYRLKMIDRDGSFTYSKVEQVAFNTQHAAFNISPNPATTSIQLQFSNLTNGKVDVQISDVAGKVLVRGSWSVVGGRLSIPMNKLANGTYIVKVIADGEAWSEKVVVGK